VRQPNPSVLPLSGIKVDKIARIILYFVEPGYNIRQAHELASQLEICEKQVSDQFEVKLDPGAALYSAFVDVRFSSRVFDDAVLPFDSFPICNQHWRSGRSVPVEFLPHLSEAARQNDYFEPIQTELRLLSKGTDIFVTEKGLLGFIGQGCHANVGDEILVLLGGNTPSVLRPLTPRPQESDQLQGPCHLHRYMDD
jgi:hypothetical protein